MLSKRRRAFVGTDAAKTVVAYARERARRVLTHGVIAAVVNVPLALVDVLQAIDSRVACNTIACERAASVSAYCVCEILTWRRSKTLVDVLCACDTRVTRVIARARERAVCVGARRVRDATMCAQDAFVDVIA